MHLHQHADTSCPVSRRGRFAIWEIFSLTKSQPQRSDGETLLSSNMCLWIVPIGLCYKLLYCVYILTYTTALQSSAVVDIDQSRC